MKSLSVLGNTLIKSTKQSKISLGVLGFVIILLVGRVDYLTGYDLGFSMFYLLPIVFVTWSIGKYAGILFSIISAIIWTTAHSIAGLIYSHSFIPYWNAMVRMVFFVTAVFILSELRTALKAQKELARMDFLTGIGNGYFFFELAAIEINRCRRYPHPLTLGYIDCDNFKQVNDSLGHKAGDALLQLVARTIKDNVRTTDIVARLGGDEFVILLPESGYESAQEFFHRLRNLLLDAMQKNEVPVTFSIGIATFISPPASVDVMIKKADDLMYLSKRNGKNMIKHEKLN